MGDMADDLFDIEVMLEIEFQQDLADNFRCNIWTTQTREEIPLDEMELSHIKNSINYIKRKGPNSIWGWGRQWLPKLEKEYEKRTTSSYNKSKPGDLLK